MGFNLSLVAISAVCVVVSADPWSALMGFNLGAWVLITIHEAVS